MENIVRLLQRMKIGNIMRKLFVIFLVITVVHSLSTIHFFPQMSIRSFAQGICDTTIQICPAPPPGSDCDPSLQICESSKYICDADSPLIRVGSSGDKVKELQTYLTDMGFGDALKPEGIDGLFGPHTENSVMQYQNSTVTLHGLDPGFIDGIVGPQTWFFLCLDVSFYFQNFTLRE